MELFSRVIGRGQPLIIIHGLFGMSDNWQSLAKQFSQFFQVHLIDQRNHGRSPHSTDFSYEVMSQDLLEYIEDHRLQDVFLLGHSLGGKTAMFFATQYPKYVQKLVVVDIGPKHYPVHHDLIISALKKMTVEPLNSRKQADQLLAQHLNELDVRQFLLKNLYWNTNKQLELRFNLDSIARNIENVGQKLNNDWIFSRPSFFVNGANSNYILEEDESGIFHHFPQAILETIDDAGHWIHAEKPQEFYQSVMRFLI